ncbi:hypothetical protein D0T50_05275 [Bacteroides sp. 214]|uniref:T9SS type A sorting domain-containing protein n=1 Tax=Bacteroides sp. 214 TaxID=2302935 RepID=UPI0013D4278F|nr:trypsin-like peptidase domain-containing protein [Bacteroides sp. 214]NDW12299.1 hypothetical protein [Bacteroides sp. 214]
MKKTILLISLFYCANLSAQVSSSFFTNKNDFDSLPFRKEALTIQHKAAIPTKKMPLVDVQRVRKEDEIQKRQGSVLPLKFGHAFNTKYTLADGTWSSNAISNIWSMTISSTGAYSLNFIFDHLFLPAGACLYIYNTDKSMVYGPVTEKQNTEKDMLFLTDLIKGDEVIIQLLEPINSKEKSSLSISRVVHGYINMFSEPGIGNASSCHNDITCHSSWSRESDAIAMILLSGGDAWCSGSLLNNTSQDFKPYFLTAYHCLDGSEQNWAFRFQYKKAMCNGTTSTSYITLNGANLRSSWQTSDFALLELTTPALNQQFTFLGWDKSNNTPTSGTGIHHPAGDVMKISFENNSFQKSTWFVNNSHWLVYFDSGIVEHGSSGSPILNQDHKVVGQLHGNQNYNPFKSYCEQPRAEYGRFDLSWTGGGTNSTRLSNWLDPIGSGVNTVETVKPDFSISGPDQICDQATYTISNLPTGATITWGSNVVFHTSTLQLVSGQGTDTAVFRKKVAGQHDIYADVTFSGQTIRLEKNNIAVGTPSLPVTWMDGTPYSTSDMVTYSITYDYQIPGRYYFIYFDDQGYTEMPYLTYDIEEVSGSCVNITRGLNCVKITPRGIGTQIFKVRAINGCGTSSAVQIRLEVRQGTSLPPGPGEDPITFSCYPNPADDIITVSISENAETKSIASKSQLAGTANKRYTIQVWHELLGMVREVECESERTQISLSGLSAGMYFVHLVVDGKAVVKQILYKK